MVLNNNVAVYHRPYEKNEEKQKELLLLTQFIVLFGCTKPRTYKYFLIAE